MSEGLDDDAELRSVTLQNARSIFIARRKAEEALAHTAERLRRSERELADFFDNASVGLHWVGQDGTILRVNRAELSMLGYSRDEYVGHNIAEFHADQTVIASILERLAAGETLRDQEARMRCKDGTLKHVLIDSSVMWDNGEFVHTRCFTRDITDRQHAIEAQTRLALIVESSQDAIISKSLAGEILSWNAGAVQLFGYQPEEAIGQSITLLIPPERLDEERVILDQLHRGERVEHYETVRVTKAGDRVDVSLTISPIRDSTGRVIGASKIARNISARKGAEQRLAVQNLVARTLAESGSLEEASPRILQSICEHLGCQVGALWYVDEREALLRCAEVYSVPAAPFPLPNFASTTRERTFEKGTGLPGRVWASRSAHCIRDVASDENFPRADVASMEGLHGALGFPIMLYGHVLGVMEFFSRSVRQPDDALLQTMMSLGSQIGQFIERTHAEAALRDSEQRFRVMAANIPSMIWTAAPDGTITYANEKWFEYCGLTPVQNASDWPQLVLHPDDRERCITAWTAALRSGTPYEIEVRNRRHDGVYHWFVTRAVPSRDSAGNIVGWFGTTTDIDEQKQAEHTTRFLGDASAALATLTDHESTLQKVASLAVPYFADWCAVDMQDAEGVVRRLAVAHVDPEKVELIRALDARYPSSPDERHGVRQVLRTGEPEWAPDIPEELVATVSQSAEHERILRELGLKSYICVPLKSRTRILGALTFVTAESGRVYDADDVRAAEDLAHRAVIAIENANLLATLKDADRRKDEFLAMLAHELRNPLAPIRNAVEIVRAKASPAPELRWAAEVIDRQVHQMTRLVDDLLDVSRITRGKIDLRKELLEIATVVRTAVEASRPIIEKWGHRLTVTLPERPIRLVADPTRLAQVLSNLLHNAAKYTNQGGRIDLTAEAGDDHVILRVKDTGIGIPPESLPRIFDMFTQVEQSIERSEGGLGIGLTLVQRLVEMHGGFVEVHSDGVGKGSEFVVRLPLSTGGMDAVGDASDRERRSVPPARRILIVDDNQDAVESLAMLLRMHGHDVHTAHDGLEAVGAAAAFQPDTILLDIGLPKLSGYEAARQIRAREGGADIVMIALTGWGQDEDRRRSQEAGFNYHMTKPVEFDVLQRLMADVDVRTPTATKS